MNVIKSGNHSFEVIDYVPYGYQIWNIGRNMIDGYLPLCRLKDKQPFEGGMSIETDTLKAIKCEGAQTILAAIGGGNNTIEKMERYLNRKRKSTYWTAKIKKALPIMKTIKWN